MKTLNKLEINQVATILDIDEGLVGDTGLAGGELKLRLMEMGFNVGARVKINSFGLFGRDPIACKLIKNGVIIALRQNEAQVIKVKED